MKRCCSCGMSAATGEFVCTACRDKYPRLGIDMVHTGVNEVTIYVPENVVVKIAPMSSGRKFVAELRKVDPVGRVREAVRNWAK